MAPMIQLEADPIYVITRVNSPAISLSRGIRLIVDPFSSIVWIMLLLTLVIMAITFTLQEAAHDNNMFVSDDHLEPQNSQPGASKRTVRETFRDRTLLILEALYYTFRSVFAASTEFNAVTWGGRVTSIAFGSFLFFGVCVYQSALTAQSTQQPPAIQPLARHLLPLCFSSLPAGRHMRA